MPRGAVSRTANVERNCGHKWVKPSKVCGMFLFLFLMISMLLKLIKSKRGAYDHKLISMLLKLIAD